MRIPIYRSPKRHAVSILPILLLAVSTLFAQQEAEESFKEYMVQKDLVIAGSSRTYAGARRTAAAAAKRMGIPLNLRDLSPARGGGLTFSKKDCREDGGEFPCYVARGRYDDGAYVSIEYSDAYSELTPGLYIVVVASAPAGDPIIAGTEHRARAIIPDAYSRRVEVYMGCMH